MEGQRYLSMLVDLAFFGVVCAFGLRHVLSEAVLATLLSSYAAHRFGVAMGKQQAVIALSGGPGGGSGPVMTDASGQSLRPSKDPNIAHRQSIEAISHKVGWIG